MSKFSKKLMSIIVTISVITSSMCTYVFADNFSKNPLISDNVVNLEPDMDIDSVVDLANDLIPSKNISKDDVIVQKNNDGNERFIVPYNSIEQSFKPINILAIMETINGDPNVSNINIQDNILTYTIFDSTDVTIIETSDGDKTTLEITEGEQTDILEFDSKVNHVFLNDELLEYNIIEAYVFEENANSKAIGDWIYYGTIYPNLRGDQAIRNLTVSSLATLLLSAFGWPGTIIGLANNILTAIIEYNSYTKVLYCEREIYRPSTGYYAFKYYDDVYADDDYTMLLESNTWTQYE